MSTLPSDLLQPTSQIRVPNSTLPPSSPKDKSEDNLTLNDGDGDGDFSSSESDIDLKQETHCLAISYDSDAITTSPELHSVSCVVYNPLRILLCFVCQIAIQPSRLRRHCREKPHFIYSVDDVFLNNLISQHNLHLSDNFSTIDAPKTPVPGIPWEDGFVCHVDGCHKAFSSKQNAKRHLSKEHGITGMPLTDSAVQIIFESNHKRYPVTAPSLTNTSSTTGLGNVLPQTPAPLQFLLERYSRTIPQVLDTPDDPAFLNPFLEKYQWVKILKDLSVPTATIRSWVSIPSNSNAILVKLEVAVQRYYQMICQEMGDWEKHTTSLRWVNSTKECAFQITAE